MTRNRPVILCIDDDPTVLRVLNLQLKQRFGNAFHFDFAESAEEGLEIIEEMAAEGEEIVMVVSDQIMPGMTGDQFLVNVHQKHPKPIKVLLTGQAAIESAINAINHANLFRYLTKPWEESDFLLTVEKGIQQYNLVNDLEEKNLQLSDTIKIFRRFVPEQIQARIAKEGIRRIDYRAAEEGTATVLFADLRGFTHMAEQKTPSETLAFLNGVMEPFIPIIHQNGGFIHQFVGDAIMAIFYEPAEDADSALTAAIEMKNALHAVNRENPERPLRMGVGLNSGSITTGLIGNDDRAEAAVIGDTVNLAARMENLTKYYQTSLLVAHHTVEGLAHPENFHLRLADLVRVSGKNEPVSVYEVFDCDEEPLRKAKQETAGDYARALKIFRERDWEGARALLRKCQQGLPGDFLVELYLKRCDDLMQNPPDEDWDGIFSLKKSA